MKASVFDILNGEFLNGRRVVDCSSNQQLVFSITDNLTRLLEARRGYSVAHIANYGIPDLTQVYHDTDSVEFLRRAIDETISEFEPRLKNIRVDYIPDEQPKDTTFRLKFIIRANLRNNRPIIFETIFTSDESPKVHRKGQL